MNFDVADMPSTMMGRVTSLIGGQNGSSSQYFANSFSLLAFSLVAKDECGKDRYSNGGR